MGYRLTKIYTRTGDNGTTGLGDTSRVDKDSLRIRAIGTIDELNSFIGLICSEDIDDDSRDSLMEIQHRLFDMGGELSMPGHKILSTDCVRNLEQQLDVMNSGLEPLEDFILPGGCKAAAVCHVARSVCRRAEREVVALSHYEKVSSTVLSYLNRLSDLLFVFCRCFNMASGHSDILWQHKKQNRS